MATPATQWSSSLLQLRSINPLGTELSGTPRSFRFQTAAASEGIRTLIQGHSGGKQPGPLRGSQGPRPVSAQATFPWTSRSRPTTLQKSPSPPDQTQQLGKPRGHRHHDQPPTRRGRRPPSQSDLGNPPMTSGSSPPFKRLRQPYARRTFTGDSSWQTSPSTNTLQFPLCLEIIHQELRKSLRICQTILKRQHLISRLP